MQHLNAMFHLYNQTLPWPYINPLPIQDFSIDIGNFPAATPRYVWCYVSMDITAFSIELQG